MFLHYLRYAILIGVGIFTVYMIMSVFCLCAMYGVDECKRGLPGHHVHARRFRRIPLGNMLYHEGINCSICLDNF